MHILDHLVLAARREVVVQVLRKSLVISRSKCFRLTGKSVLSEIEICHSLFQKMFLTGWLGSSWSFFLFLLRMAGSGLEEAEDILPPSDEIRPRAGRRPAIAIAPRSDTTVCNGREIKSRGRKFREKRE